MARERSLPHHTLVISPPPYPCVSCWCTTPQLLYHLSVVKVGLIALTDLNPTAVSCIIQSATCASKTTARSQCAVRCSSRLHVFSWLRVIKVGNMLLDIKMHSLLDSRRFVLVRQFHAPITFDRTSAKWSKYCKVLFSTDSQKSTLLVAFFRCTIPSGHLKGVFEISLC